MNPKELIFTANVDNEKPYASYEGDSPFFNYEVSTEIFKEKYLLTIFKKENFKKEKVFFNKLNDALKYAEEHHQKKMTAFLKKHYNFIEI